MNPQDKGSVTAHAKTHLLFRLRTAKGTYEYITKHPGWNKFEDLLYDKIQMFVKSDLKISKAQMMRFVEDRSAEFADKLLHKAQLVQENIETELKKREKVIVTPTELDPT